MRKICPFRFNNSVGNMTTCVGSHCTMWVNGECAIVKIAKAVKSEKDDDK